MNKLEQIKAERCRRRFSYFVKEFWGEINSCELIWEWYLDVYCDNAQKAVQRVIDGKPVDGNYLFNVPPGTTKSTIFTRMLPLWVWTNKPSLKFIMASYNYDLSLELGDDRRKIADSYKYQKFFPEIKLETNTSTKIKNTQGGAIYIASVSASIIGFHADIHVIDDPLNIKKSASDDELVKTNDWLKKELSGRKTNHATCVQIMVMQRLHTQDCSGYWIDLAKRGVKLNHFCLPAEINSGYDVMPKELIKYYDKDGLLSPERLNQQVLDEKKEQLGSSGYASQIGQSPKIAGGNMIKDEWILSFKLHELEAMASDAGETLVWDYYIDSAQTKNMKKNDPSVCWNYTVFNNRVYVKAVFRKWLPFTQLVKELIKFFKETEYKVGSTVRFENKSNGLDLVDTFVEETGFDAVVYKIPKGTKAEKLQPYTPAVEAGRLLFLENAYWVEQTTEELTTFPFDKHDEHIDCLAAVMRICKDPEKTEIYIFGDKT